MWYVVQVTSGQEQKVASLVERTVRDRLEAGLVQSPKGAAVLKECFVPLYQTERKFHGEYRLVERNLFPGYVIAVSSDAIELNRIMREVSAFTRILGNDKAFIPLDRTEMAFINSFTSEQHRIIRISRAVVEEGERIRVLEGPMVGREGWIKRINRRKGTAQVETEMFGRMISVEIGLAVMAKSEDLKKLI